MSTEVPVAGQRWVSDSEPELGLGIVLQADAARVEIFFPASNEHRQYAARSAPLRRVRFKEGDTIRSHEGSSAIVVAVEERAGLLVYRTAQRDLTEAELSDVLSFSKPEERLLIGQVEEPAVFDLRADALRWRAGLRGAPVRGFVGGRVDLVPHQISVASEVAGRLLPRVLLADEVGLGKTIEAGLILHRLHLAGRASRVLLLVPEALVNQWFIEFYRRFNLTLSIFDEERCVALQLNHPEANPFLDSQWVLCSREFLSGRSQRAAEALAAGWDLVVMDEAHHLQWSSVKPSSEYLLAEAFAKSVPGLLLLTATPQQLGPESHFARLRLLDPERYCDLERFTREAAQYEKAAAAADRLIAGKKLTKADLAFFGKQSESIRMHGAELEEGNEAARSLLLAELLDGFGTGRVMFRNTRKALSGFPVRKARLYPLAKDSEPRAARMRWLAALLKKLGKAKVLLICRERTQAEWLGESLPRETAVQCAVFHEGLNLLQRDRNAAYFAEEEGARILLCSEIGSEGRNFQFAHHLVLFDLPENPELLEQRIGRLDRIGQTATIQIHVPYEEGTGEEVQARWYHEGLNAFEKVPQGAGEIAAQTGALRSDLAQRFDPEGVAGLLERTQELHQQVGRKLQRGYDRLLELNSSKPEKAAELIAEIRRSDEDRGFEHFFVRLMDHFGVHVEELASRDYLLRPGHLLTDAFPALPEAGLSGTFDRARALSREDLAFLSADHPLAAAVLDLLLSSEMGNSSFGLWQKSGSDAILLEVMFVVECVAPAALHLDRFLPPTPVRIAVDHLLTDLSEDGALLKARLDKGDVLRLLDKSVVKRKFFPAMLEKAATLAAEKAAQLAEAARAEMVARMGGELERLRELQRRNDHVRLEEVELLERQRGEMEGALGTARARADGLRLILRTA
jgi:ATP-dependent helicase HepA